MGARLAVALLFASVFVSSRGVAQEEQELLVRVELVLESHDPSVDRDAVIRAVHDAQSEARGRALTVLHVVVPVDGDAEIHVHELTDDAPAAIESFVIPRGGPDWLRDALVQHVARRLVPVRVPTNSLLFSWDGTRSLRTRPDLVEWQILRVEDATNLSTPPR